jgi:hypothetical protein
VIAAAHEKYVCGGNERGSGNHKGRFGGRKMAEKQSSFVSYQSSEKDW